MHDPIKWANQAIWDKIPQFSLIPILVFPRGSKCHCDLSSYMYVHNEVTVVGVFKEARCHGLTLDKSKKILTEQLINSDSKLVFNGQT